MSVNIIGIFDPNSPLILGSSLTLGGTLTMPNNTAFQLKNAAGTAQNVLYMNTSDWVQLSSPSGTLALNRSTATDIDVWGVVGTGRTLNLYGSDAADGELKDSPTLKLVGFYDADPTAGVTNTAFPYSVLLNMTAGGAAPAASGLHKINSVTVLTLTNTNGTPKVNLGASSLYADYFSLVFNGGTDRTIAINNGGHVYFRNETSGNGFQFKNSSDIGLFNVDQFGNFSFKAAAEGGTASLNVKIARQVVALSGAQTSTTINIPAGAMLLGASFNVDTAVVTSAATNTWDADFTGGSTTNLVAASTAGAQNTKANKLIVPEVATAQTNIEFDAPGAETFSSGAIEVVAYYIDQTSLANA